MIKLIRIKVAKEDYEKVCRLMKQHHVSGIEVTSSERSKLIKFCCNIFKSKKIKHDLELAIELGIGAKFEVL